MRATAVLCFALVAFAAADDLFKPEEDVVLLEEEAEPSQMWDPMMMGGMGMYNPYMMGMFNPYMMGMYNPYMMMMMMNPFMFGAGMGAGAQPAHASFLEEEAQAEPSQVVDPYASMMMGGMYNPYMMMMGGMYNPYMMMMGGMYNPYMMMGLF